MTFVTWNQCLKEKYYDFMTQRDANSPAERLAVMKPLIAELDAREAKLTPEELVQSASRRFRAAVAELTAVVSVYLIPRRFPLIVVDQARAWFVHGDVHVGGVVMYTGSHHGVRAQSMFFTGSPDMEEIVAANVRPAKAWIDKMLALLRCVAVYFTAGRD